MYRLDESGNTALHYGKGCSDQSRSLLLLNHGARIQRNRNGVLNVDIGTLCQFLTEHCVTSEGNQGDDGFKIKIKYAQFAKANTIERQELAS